MDRQALPLAADPGRVPSLPSAPDEVWLATDGTVSDGSVDGDWDVDGFPGLMVVDSRERCWQFGAADRDGTEGDDLVDVEEAFVEGAEKGDPVEGNEEGDPVDVEEAFVEGSLIEGVQETTWNGEEKLCGRTYINQLRGSWRGYINHLGGSWDAGRDGVLRQPPGLHRIE